MSKSAKISILLYTIFVLGIIGVAVLVNKTLNKNSQINISFPPESVPQNTHVYKL